MGANLLKMIFMKCNILPFLRTSLQKCLCVFLLPRNCFFLSLIIFLFQSNSSQGCNNRKFGDRKVLHKKVAARIKVLSCTQMQQITFTLCSNKSWSICFHDLCMQNLWTGLLLNVWRTVIKMDATLPMVVSVEL